MPEWSCIFCGKRVDSIGMIYLTTSMCFKCIDWTEQNIDNETINVPGELDNV